MGKMKVIESPPSKERLQLLQAVAEDAAEILNVDIKNGNSKNIVEKINEVIINIIFEESNPIPKDEEPHLLLGCLWGEQMAKQFGWYWADVEIDEKFNEIAMISENQEMIIFPLSFVEVCLNKQCISTVALAFNMLLEDDRKGVFDRGSYENIMQSIHHFIPPYTLT